MNRIVKKILSVICFIIFFILIRELLRYCLVDDTKSYTRISMHEFYTSKENIDILFIGSSHTYRSIVPQIADKSFGKYTFNAGSSSQGMDGSLAITKEAIKEYDIKEIYLEVCYEIAVLEGNKDRTEMTSTYILSDYMKPSLNRLFYILNAISNQHYINSFILARRHWENLLNPKKVIEIIKSKQTDNNKNYIYVPKKNSEEYYVERGFVANDSILSSDSIEKNKIETINFSNISNDWKKQLNEIIHICKEKGIKLTLFIAPEPAVTTNNLENYDEYSKMINGIAIENNIDYYDFNYCKKEYFDRNDLTLFKDTDHLNTKGAEKFTQLFGDLISGKITHDDIFNLRY